MGLLSVRATRAAGRLPLRFALRSCQKPMSLSSDPGAVPDDFWPHVAAGEDEQLVRKDAASLVSRDLRGTGHWRLTPDAGGIERVFRFKTFKTTWEFMSRVARMCKEQKHHPEWTNIYNKTHVVWTTHNPQGLTTKDILMATFCDSAAKGLSELEPTVEQSEEDERHFRNRGMEAPDCCSKRSL